MWVLAREEHRNDNDELSDSSGFLGRPGRDAAFRGGRPAFGTGLKNDRMSFEEDISHPADQGDELQPIDEMISDWWNWIQLWS